MTSVSWAELKALGYRAERIVGTNGWRAPCWYSYNSKDHSFAGSKHYTKGDAMRACRDHYVAAGSEPK